MDVIDFIERFQLDTLPEFWVDSIWEKEFSEEKKLPPAYCSSEEIDFFSLMNNFSEFIKYWINDSDNNSDPDNNSDRDCSAGRKSWHTLISQNVNHKGLIAVISIFIKENLKELRNEDDVNLALQASRLYFMLISIDGAHMFNLFNSTLFRQALNTLKILKLILCEEDYEKKSSKSKKCQDDGKQSGEKSRSKNGKGSESRSMDDDNEDETDNYVLSYDIQEKTELIKTGLIVLNDLAFCLESIDVQCKDEIIKQTVQSLLMIATLEKTCNIFTSHIKTNDLAQLSFKSFNILLKMSQPSSCQEENVRIIIINLLDYLSPAGQDFTYSNFSRSLSVMRNNILDFLFRIVSIAKNKAYKGLIILVQQLIIRTPEKADIRAKCVQQITNILERVPIVVFNQLLFWIVSCCWDDSPTYRLISVHILSSLLLSAHKNKHLYQIEHFNASDNLNSTSVQSEEVISECETQKNSTDGVLTKNSINHSAIEIPNIPSASPNRASSIIESNLSSEKKTSCTTTASNDIGNSSLIETPFCLNIILSAIISTCKDKSPKVRGKALSSLASVIVLKEEPVSKCIMETFVHPYESFEVVDKVISEDRKLFDFKTYLRNLRQSAPPGCLVSINLNSDPMPGGTYIMNLVEQLTYDDKQSVRKAAFSVICNICLISGKWLTPRRLDLLCGVCKDPSLIIRKNMISSLTDLLLTYPTNDLLINVWVNGIFPLLGDNELTSEEKTLEVITKVIFENLDYYKKTVTAHSLLPWKVILLIIKEGKRNLFRIICRHWNDSNRISSNLVKILRSHIGTDNNIGALFLLVTIAEFHNIERPDFLVDLYFSKIYNCNQTTQCEEYESYLIVEGIFLNINTINSENKWKLCSKIKESISSFSVPIILISKYIDIVHKCCPDEINEWCGKLVKECESGIRRMLDGHFDDTIFCQYIYTLGEAAMIAYGLVSQEIFSSLINIIDINDKDNELFMKFKDKLSDKTLAVSVISLGKLSLQTFSFAKSSVPVFGTLLMNNCPKQVKINSLIALTDLCSRYTTLVEIYIGDMCVCLKDKDLAVRKSAFSSLVKLITEEYIKLRSPYFFYILSLIEDVSDEIREETLSFLVNYAKLKQKGTGLNFLIQSLFFFNELQGNNIYSSVVMQSRQEQKVFCFSGKKYKALRHKLYRFLLEHMEDDHRWKAMYKIAKEVLSEVAQGKIKLDNIGSDLLEDALYCLSCDEIKFVNIRRSGDLMDDEDGNAQEIVKTIRDSSVALECLKRTYSDYILPIMLDLKEKLSEMKSPLLRDFRVALREMMKGFKKDEIYSLLSNDPVAAAEIDFELRKISSEEEPISAQNEELLINVMNNNDGVLNNSEQLFKEDEETNGETVPTSCQNNLNESEKVCDSKQSTLSSAYSSISISADTSNANQTTAITNKKSPPTKKKKTNDKSSNSSYNKTNGSSISSSCTKRGRKKK